MDFGQPSKTNETLVRLVLLSHTTSCTGLDSFEGILLETQSIGKNYHIFILLL